MTREEAKQIIIQERDSLKANPKVIVEECLYDAFEMAIKALELLDTLTDRPCEVCKHHKENGCCKWDCVFDGMI